MRDGDTHKKTGEAQRPGEAQPCTALHCLGQGHLLRTVFPEVKHVKFTCLNIRVHSCSPGSRTFGRSDPVAYTNSPRSSGAGKGRVWPWAAVRGPGMYFSGKLVFNK